MRSRTNDKNMYLLTNSEEKRLGMKSLQHVSSSPLETPSVLMRGKTFDAAVSCTTRQTRVTTGKTADSTEVAFRKLGRRDLGRHVVR